MIFHPRVIEEECSENELLKAIGLVNTKSQELALIHFISKTSSWQWEAKLKLKERNARSK